MKKTTFYVAMLLSFTFFSCNTEDVTDQELNKDPNFRVAESTTSNTANRASLEDPCSEVNLIAGQNQVAGKVSVDMQETDLIITITTDPGWTISETHLSIGNCDEQWVPTTGSGNPKIGHFEHSTSHNGDVTQVSYTLDSNVLDEAYCFAAHAVVSGPTGGETAWGEGLDFDGNSWAMYVEANKSDCNIDGEPEGPTK
jgi:hypothetical protein